MEQLDLAPGRLGDLLRGARSGHHPLFAPGEIRRAFESPEVPVTRDNAGELGEVLIALARDPLEGAAVLRRLSDRSRSALIRVWFRLLERSYLPPTLH
jgi:hypothetical protein